MSKKKKKRKKKKKEKGKEGSERKDMTATKNSKSEIPHWHLESRITHSSLFKFEKFGLDGLE